MPQSADEKLLFKSTPRAEKLRAQAKKLAREQKRREWYNVNKPK